jgi:competence ComEA-like helix-hairpin-helix protein
VPYSRQQLALLLLLMVAAATGLGIGHWRRSHPRAAARLELLDQGADTEDGQGAAPRAGPAAAGDRAVPLPSPTVRDQRRNVASADSTATGTRRASRPRKETASRRAATGTPLPAVDLNRASPEELMQLPGIGPVLAGRIVAARAADGTFTSVDDLRRVSGVGPARIERLRSLVTAAP